MCIAIQLHAFPWRLGVGIVWMRCIELRLDGVRTVNIRPLLFGAHLLPELTQHFADVVVGERRILLLQHWAHLVAK